MICRFYSVSVLYCLTTSLAHDGEGLGTCGLHEPKVRRCARWESGLSCGRATPVARLLHVHIPHIERSYMRRKAG